MTTPLETLTPPLEIVLCCDGAYVMQLATTLRSVTESCPSAWPIAVHVLCHGIGETSRQNVLASLPPRSVTIRWVDVDVQMFSHLGRGITTHVSLASYTRFLLPQVFPASTQKLLYLDTDLLVVQDLAPLWQTDLTGQVLAAVHDHWSQWIKEGGIPGVPVVQSYFNAGVLLINLPEWRRQTISERALDYLQQHPQTPFMDQDALNVACDGAWLPVPGPWNFQDHRVLRLDQIPPAERPAIIHFIGKEKPWVAKYPNQYVGVYDTYRDHTRFPRTRLQRLTDPFRSVPFRLKRKLQRLLSRR